MLESVTASQGGPALVPNQHLNTNGRAPSPAENDGKSGLEKLRAFDINCSSRLYKSEKLAAKEGKSSNAHAGHVIMTTYLLNVIRKNFKNALKEKIISLSSTSSDSASTSASTSKDRRVSAATPSYLCGHSVFLSSSPISSLKAKVASTTDSKPIPLTFNESTKQEWLAGLLTNDFIQVQITDVIGEYVRARQVVAPDDDIMPFSDFKTYSTVLKAENENEEEDEEFTELISDAFVEVFMSIVHHGKLPSCDEDNLAGLFVRDYIAKVPFIDDVMKAVIYKILLGENSGVLPLSYRIDKLEGRKDIYREIASFGKDWLIKLKKDLQSLKIDITEYDSFDDGVWVRSIDDVVAKENDEVIKNGASLKTEDDDVSFDHPLSLINKLVVEPLTEMLKDALRIGSNEKARLERDKANLQSSQTRSLEELNYKLSRRDAEIKKERARLVQKDNDLKAMQSQLEITANKLQMKEFESKRAVELDGRLKGLEAEIVEANAQKIDFEQKLRGALKKEDEGERFKEFVFRRQDKLDEKNKIKSFFDKWINSVQERALISRTNNLVVKKRIGLALHIWSEFSNVKKVERRRLQKWVDLSRKPQLARGFEILRKPVDAKKHAVKQRLKTGFRSFRIGALYRKVEKYNDDQQNIKALREENNRSQLELAGSSSQLSQANDVVRGKEAEVAAYIEKEVKLLAEKKELEEKIKQLEAKQEFVISAAQEKANSEQAGLKQQVVSLFEAELKALRELQKAAVSSLDESTQLLLANSAKLMPLKSESSSEDVQQAAAKLKAVGDQLIEVATKIKLSMQSSIKESTFFKRSPKEILEKINEVSSAQKK